MAKDLESCGRCSTTVVIDAANADRDEDARADRDPYGEDRIEVEEREFRLVAPGFWLSRLGERLDDATTRLTWNR